MDFDPHPARALLRLGTGDATADFRPGQLEAIRHVVTGAGRLLVVRKTGWGKSFVYFIGTKLLREAGMGPALLVSPLPSPMRNRIAAAGRMGVVAETVNSSNPDDWERIEQSVEDDLVDILLVSPERFANDRFRSGLLARLAERISLMALESPTPLVREGGRWQLTATTLDRAFWQRTERLGSLRRQEQVQMQEYVDLSQGHMEFPVRALDGAPVAAVGPGLPPLAATVDERTVGEATLFLKATSSWELRRNGCEAVWPLALADAGTQ